ncbi:thiopurine S-methyltransferase [Ixodes scapularis]
MCGKAPELKWFYDRGHRVVGVEFFESCVRSFFVDNGIPFDEAVCPVLKCKILQTADKRLRIFVCDLFDFEKSCAGEMDIVWDRGSLSSVDIAHRDRYVTLIKSLLAPNFSYGLWAIVYDDDQFKECPKSTPEPVLRKLYEGNGLKLRLVDTYGPKTVPFTKSPANFYLWHVTE